MAEGHHLVGQLLSYDAGKFTWAEWIEILKNCEELNEIDYELRGADVPNDEKLGSARET